MKQFTSIASTTTPRYYSGLSLSGLRVCGTPLSATRYLPLPKAEDTHLLPDSSSMISGGGLARSGFSPLRQQKINLISSLGLELDFIHRPAKILLPRGSGTGKAGLPVGGER